MDEATVPPRFIEFLGLPGTGKTTIVSHLAELMRDNQVVETRSRSHLLADSAPAVSRHLRRMLVVVRGFALRPALFLRLLRLVVRSGQESPRDAAKVIWNFWSVLGMVAVERRRSGIVLVDQGLAQAMWSVLLTSRSHPDLSEWQAFFDAVGLRDLSLVVLRAPSALLHERLTERPGAGTRMKQQGRLDNDAIWARAEERMAQVNSLMRDLLPEERMQCYSTDGEATSADIARSIRRHLPAGFVMMGEG